MPSRLPTPLFALATLASASVAASQSPATVARWIRELDAQDGAQRVAAARSLRTARGRMPIRALERLLADDVRHPLELKNEVHAVGGRIALDLDAELAAALGATGIQDHVHMFPVLIERRGPTIAAFGDIAGDRWNPRVIAAWLLGSKRPAERVAPALVRALGEPFRSLQRQCVAALRALGDDHAVAEAFVAAFAHNDEPVLAEAFALAIDNAAERAGGLLAHGDPSVVLQAISVLWFRPAEANASIPSLTTLVAHDDDALRVRAAGTLARIGAPAVEAIAALLEHKDARVRRDAARILGVIGRHARPATAALLRATADADAGVRNATIAALAALGAAPAEREQAAIARALEAASGDPDPRTRAIALVALRRCCAASDAAEGILAALSAPDVVVRASAAACLDDPHWLGTQWLITHGARVLGKLHAATRDHDPIVRRLARSSLAALLAHVQVPVDRWSEDPALDTAVRDLASDDGVRRANAAKRLRAAGSAALPVLTRVVEAALAFAPMEPQYLGSSSSGGTQRKLGPLAELRRDLVPDVRSLSTSPPRAPSEARPRTIRGTYPLRFRRGPRVAAALLLGELGADATPAVGALWDAINDADLTLAEQATQALVAIGDAAITSGLARIGDPISRDAVERVFAGIGEHVFRPVLDAAADARAAVPCLTVLHRIGPRAPDAAIPRLIGHLQRQAPGAELAAGLLARYGQGAASPLVALLQKQPENDNERRTQQMAVAALHQIGPPAASAAEATLRRLATDPRQCTASRQLALGALAAIFGARATGAQLAALKDREPRVRLSALLALASIDRAAATRARSDALADSAWFLRAAALYLLSEASDLDAAIRERALELENDPDHRVRTAARALRRSGSN